MTNEVSNNRLYLGNLPRDVTKGDIEDHFATHGTGKITDIKLMNGFGFIEYEDAMDARDVVPAFHGTTLNGERMTVQFARGSRPRDEGFGGGRSGDDFQRNTRPRRTQFRMAINGLPEETSWQDLKDFARQSGLDVVYSEASRGGSGEGAFVEFVTADDLRTAIDKLDGLEFKGVSVQCSDDTQPFAPRDNRGRSRSPQRRFGGNDYGRRGPPGRGYSPPRGYRDRSPPPPRRNYHDDRDRYRSPPRARGPPGDDYHSNRRAPYEDSYRRDRGPPSSSKSYANGNGHDRSYDRDTARDTRDVRDNRGGRDDFNPPREPAHRGGSGYDRGRDNY